MTQELTCTLCENHCKLSELGCIKGQRFYEQPVSPYCTLCENHCLLSQLQCAKGKAFYEQAPKQKDTKPVHQAKPTNLMSLYEQAIYQFQRIRGGLSSQMRVLRFLHNHGSITQSEMQQALTIKAAAMSELVTKMVDQGLITRTPSKTDKRAKVLRLTDAGKDAYAQQAAYEERLHIFGSLSPEEVNQLESILKKLSQDWRSKENISEALVV